MPPVDIAFQNFFVSTNVKTMFDELEETQINFIRKSFSRKVKGMKILFKASENSFSAS